MLLPSSRALLSSLFTSFSNTQPASTAPTSLDDARRSLLSTLHVLFPNHLLPALDLLDRNLVVRIVATNQSALQPGVVTTECVPPLNFLVYSSTLSSGRSFRRRRKHVESGRDGGAASVAGGKAHLVNLATWNCNCPSFAYDAFVGRNHGLEEDECAGHPESIRGPKDAPDVGKEQPTNVLALAGVDQTVWADVFGGFSRESAPPCCKHILACLLAEKCSLIDGGIPETALTREQLAGLVFEMA
ncbi:hypothetical protein BROUX41_003333 [Berkeleyomyces rouxiae]|uniref:uncharacterized protein n=1 Tax=Berkeleyomyces rouxiae TaxID=2035830 RepID=UPI003B7BE9E4